MQFGCLRLSALLFALLSARLMWGGEITSNSVSKPISPSHLTILGLTLGTSTLADIKTQLGDVAVIDRGDAGLSLRLACYIAANGDDTQLVFESGAMGGWTKLTGFRIFLDKNRRDTPKQCRVSRRIGRHLRTAGGLGLGLSKAQVVKLLGLPAVTDNNKFTYESVTTKRVLADTFDIQTVIEIDFDEMSVSSVNVSRTETN